MNHLNYYNPYVRQELELYHHGVAGQKWGKRNGPPYPLGSSQVSSAEKKAGWKKSDWAVKAAKATGKATVKAAKATGKAVNIIAVRKGIKPKVLMSDDEIKASMQRKQLEIDALKQNKNYQRALRGKFTDIQEVQKQRINKEGKTILSNTKDIFKEKLIPTVIAGTATYMLAKHVAKRHGEELPSAVGMIFGQTGYLSNDNKGKNKGKNKGGNGGNSDGNGNSGKKKQ